MKVIVRASFPAHAVAPEIRPRLPALGELTILLIVATLLVLPAPFVPNQLPAAWAGSDLMISHWPTALMIQRTFAQGQGLPLWNPYFGGGLPLAADPLAAFFYPPTQLVHFLPVFDYYLVLILGHLVFAGLGMLLLARRAVGLPRLPALVAAVSYMAAPRLLSHLGAGHITIVQTVAWYPWLALACWATVQDPRRWGPFLGICIAMTLLAGHPQMAYYGLLMTAILAAWLLVRRCWQTGWRALPGSVAGLAAAGVIGVLLAAIYVLPLLELTAQSTRQLPIQSTEAYRLHDFLSALLEQKLPPTTTPWELMLSPGPVVLALAALALLTRLRKALPLVLGIIVVAELAMGNDSQFYLQAARILPDLDLFRGLARIWFVALVAFALLAGLGADWVLRGVLRIWPRATAVAGFLTILIVALSLIITDTGYARTGDASAATTPSLLSRTAAQLAGSGRIYGAQENVSQLSAVQLDVRLADGWDPLLIQAYVSYMGRAGGDPAGGYQLHIPANESSSVQPNATLLGLMNVSVVVSDWRLTDPQLVQVGKVDGTFIYKNTADAGPGYLVDPGPDGNPPALARLTRQSVRVRTVSQTPEQDVFTFSTRTAAYFVIATPAFPGWVARLDGNPAPIQHIAGVLPAIKVNAGTHTLSYTYAPSSVRLGAMLSVIGLLAALAWLIVIRYFRPGKLRRAPKHGLMYIIKSASSPDADHSEPDAGLIPEREGEKSLVEKFPPPSS